MPFDKNYCYDLLEKLHLIREHLTYDAETDLMFFCKTYNLTPEKSAIFIFTTLLAIFKDLHVYEIDPYAHRLINNTLVTNLSQCQPLLLKAPFLLTTPKPIIAGFNTISYSLHSDDTYLMQFGSSTPNTAAVAMQGKLCDIGNDVRFDYKNYGHHITPDMMPAEKPEEIKTAIFKYLFTFAVLLQAEKTPVLLEGHPRKISNHYAKKHNVSKTVWVTNKVYLNATLKRHYEEHTPMDLTDKVATPRLTKAHVRCIRDKNNRERQVFVGSYVSVKHLSKKLKRTQVGVL